MYKQCIHRPLFLKPTTYCLKIFNRFSNLHSVFFPRKTGTLKGTLFLFVSENITQIQFQSARGNCTGANCDFSSLFEQVLSIVKCPMVEGWSLGPAYFDIPRSLISYVDIKLAFEDNYLGSTLVEKKCNSCKYLAKSFLILHSL